MDCFKLKAFNIYETLNKIGIDIHDNAYTNHYDIWTQLADTYNLFKDFHVSFDMGCARTVSYKHDYPIISVLDAHNRERSIRFSGNNIKLGETIGLIDGEQPMEYLEAVNLRVTDAIDYDTQ